MSWRISTDDRYVLENRSIRKDVDGDDDLDRLRTQAMRRWKVNRHVYWIRDTEDGRTVVTIGASRNRG